MELVSQSNNLTEKIAMFLNRDDDSITLDICKNEEIKLKRYIDQQDIQVGIEIEKIPSSDEMKVTLTKTQQK
jgi:hypothetical protein